MPRLYASRLLCLSACMPEDLSVSLTAVLRHEKVPFIRPSPYHLQSNAQKIDLGSREDRAKTSENLITRSRILLLPSLMSLSFDFITLTSL